MRELEREITDLQDDLSGPRTIDVVHQDDHANASDWEPDPDANV